MPNVSEQFCGKINDNFQRVTFVELRADGGFGCYQGSANVAAQPFSAIKLSSTKVALSTLSEDLSSSFNENKIKYFIQWKQDQYFIQWKQDQVLAGVQISYIHGVSS